MATLPQGISQVIFSLGLMFQTYIGRSTVIVLGGQQVSKTITRRSLEKATREATKNKHLPNLFPYSHSNGMHLKSEILRSFVAPYDCRGT
jgi:hypothetical protein